MSITKEQVTEFLRYMEKAEGFKTIQKANAEEMKAIAWAVGLIGGDDDWMKKYAITLGERVYVPFVVGSGSEADKISQIGAICHEAQHVRQFGRNPVGYPVAYASSDAARTNYEVDAYRVTMEMHYYFTGRILAPKFVASKLSGYYVSDADIRIAEKHFIAVAECLRFGLILSGISKSAIRYWDKRIHTHAKVILKKSS